MVQALAPGMIAGSSIIPWLGITGHQLTCFMVFWALQVAIIVRGIECIKDIEKCSAPILVVLAAALLIWAVTAAGGCGPMLSAPSQFGPGKPLQGKFWGVFFPAVTANVGYWATLSLNIPDFSRSGRVRQVTMGRGIDICTVFAANLYLSTSTTCQHSLVLAASISWWLAAVQHTMEGARVLGAECCTVQPANTGQRLMSNVDAPALYGHKACSSALLHC